MRFVLKAIVYVVMMNAVMFLGAMVFGTDFEVNFIFNLLVPVICAYASWDVERRKTKKAAQR